MKKAIFLLINILLFLSHISSGQIVSSEGNYTLFIKEDGTLWAWGDNSSGQLGDGTTTNRNTPVNIQPGTKWISVATSSSTSFGIKKDGTLWVWGSNSSTSEIFGNNIQTIVNKLIPEQVGTDTNWKSIATNGRFAVGLKSDGTLWNWGYNANGVLGDGTSVAKAVPTKLGTDTNWSSFTLNGYMTMAIKQNGTLWGWGYNGESQFYLNNSNLSSNIPIQINTDTDWKMVDLGASHALAIKQDGSLWAWGSNSSGQLGDGTTVNKSTPTRIGSENNWISASAGSSSMALKSNGSLWVWGANDFGQLGLGHFNLINSPTQIGNSVNWKNIYAGNAISIATKTDNSNYIWGAKDMIGLGLETTKKSPTQIISNVGWKEVSSYYNYTFGIKLDGTLWAWGNNSTGIFGNNSKVSSNIPVQIGSATNWKSVVLCLGTVTALKTDGTLWTWGTSNWAGTLGNGSNIGSNTITRVGTESNWDKIYGTGGNVFAIKANGSLWGWGFNASYSVIGNTQNSILTPVQIGTDLNWKSIGSGFTFTIGLKTDGTLWGWGDNSEGRLGLNTTISTYSTPQRIGNQSNWTAISSSYESTIALNSLGTVWTWGRNQYGSLGFDPAITRFLNLPSQISSIVNGKDISCGYYSSAAVKTDGSLWAWGDNSSGELGDGSTSNFFTGKRIGADSNWDRVFTSGSPITFAIKTDGSLYGWGMNNNGQLGVGEYGYQSTPTQLFAADNTPTVKIFAGGYSNFKIKEDGTLWAWGNNSGGQLGLGHKNFQSYPVQVGTSADWKFISTTNSSFTLAIKNDGSLWGWGQNGTNGYLGIGDPTVLEYLTPTRIGTALDWETLSSGTQHTLAIKSNGTLWAWGYNLYGSIGDGTTITKTSPTQIGSDTDWKIISASLSSSYAIKQNGILYSWGQNNFGQIGDGTYSSKTSPSIVGSSTDWVSVEGGHYNVLAIKSNGSLWGWGANYVGQLGDGTTINKSVPTQIGTSLDWLLLRASKSLPFNFSIKTNGTLWSTGINIVGALGVGDLNDRSAFTQVGDQSNWKDLAIGSGHVFAFNNSNILYSWGGNSSIGKKMNTPIKQIGSLSNWNNIISGSSISATIKSDGTLWMWGLNSNGQLGDGTIINKDIPTQIGTSLNWKSISLGSSHTVGLKNDGSIWSWGANTYGQLGDGTTTSKLTPVQIGSSLDWKSVFCGDSQTFAIKNDGSLWAWGYNSNGRLGDGSSINRNIPVRIGNENNWKEISTGLDFTTALKYNGTLWSWGNNYSGQLGDGTTINKLVPTQIGSSTDWNSIYSGNNYAGAIKNDGTIWFWGNNSSGQLGNNSTTNVSTPTKIGNENNWKKLALGDSHSLALKNDNSLWSWGNNGYGQLGDGTVISSYTPQKIGFEYDWNQIAAGSHTFAIKSDGTLWGSGLNVSGQLGDGKAFFTSPSLLKPIVEITQSGKSAYCSTGSITLTASEGLSYTWSTGATTRSITVNTSGTYSVTVTYPIGDIVTSDPVYIPVSPNTTISTTGSMMVNRYEDLKSFKMTVAAGNGLTYQWYNNGVAIPGALTNAFVPKKNGAYTVSASNNLGCVSSSITKTVNFVLSDTLTYSKVAANSNLSLLIKPNGTLWGWGLNTSGQLGVGDKINRGYAVQVGTSADWKMVASAGSFTIGLKKDGSLWSWGLNSSSGYLGNGNTSITESLVPTRIGTANDWSSIAVGNNFTIALKTDGTIWGWGYNYYGQLGDQSNTSRTAPVQIGTDSDWSIISAGGNSTYAIKLNGSLYAWGMNTSYQLGDGTNVNKNTPTRIGTSNDWGLINAGSNYAIALKTDGSLWGWGINSSGQLGISNTSNVTIPTQIGSDLNWVNVLTSSYSNSSLAIKSNGTLWSTGYNNYGQLGQNNINTYSSFTQIGTNTNWRSASIGSGHALALDNLNKVYSWGYNSSGQIGNGLFNYNLQAKQVGTDLNWDKIYSGYNQSAGIKKDGTLWAWGRNIYGQLGDGTNINKETPTQIGTSTNWKSIALGYYHTVAIKADGSLWSWGLNSSGQLGDGSGSNQFTHVQIGSSTDWKMVSAGTNFTIALKNNGTLWAWGYNNDGQLGNGTTSNVTTPIQIGTATDWVSISAGYNHALALKTNSTIWTWGANYSGQLGNGNTTNSNVPIQIGSDSDWTAIHAGLEYSFATKSNKTEWSWGSNFYGQLADGTTVDKNIPTQVLISDIQKWPNATAGYHNSIIKTDGSLWSWGYNTYGQLGDGTLINKSTPIKIGEDTDWNQIAVGSGHTFATKTDGSLWSWGYNFYGQLGQTLPVYYAPSLTKPIVEITASGRAKYCAGGSIVLTASEGLSYTWSTGATTRSITVNTPGNYRVTVTYPIGDVVTSDVTTISSIQNLSITTSGSMVQNRLDDLKSYKLTVPSVSGQNYQWYNNGVLIPGATLNTFAPKKNGAYTVTSINSTGCSASSISKTVTFVQSDTLTQAVAAANTNSSFIIKSNGTLWAWGNNSSGQLGTGNKVNQNIAVQIGTANDWKMISSSTNSSYTIALKKDGTLWGWGFNGSYGYLGIGNTSNESLIPIRIGSDNDWESISSGYSHTIALKKNGTLWGWGYNIYGQLGDGTNTSKYAPIQIGNESDWSSIGTGSYSSYAIKNNGSLYAWGDNYNKQLGDGTNVSKNIPTRIGAANDWGLIKGANSNVLALKTDGTLWGWGINSYGQLGNGSQSIISTPTQIGTEVNWVNIYLSNNHGFALKSNGTLWSTGYNFSGQLGQGNTNNYSSFTQIGTNTSWRSASLGSSFSLALDNLNNLYSWGDNVSGQLGKGDIYNNPLPRQVGSELTWDKAFAGLAHSGALKLDGSLWMWGRNRYGQLGDGLSATNVDIPKQVGSGTDWKYLALGGYQTSALKKDGSLWAWGLNSSGQLGDGTTIQRTTPVQIGNSTDWSAISAGLTHTVGLKSNGTLWYWGTIMNGTFSITSYSPIQPDASTNWSAISAGSSHTLALKSNGTLWTWGENGYGQLGLGNSTDVSTPTQVGTATDWAYIQAGSNNSIAIKKDGTVWVWGYNEDGELGDGSIINKNTPTQLLLNNIVKWSASTLSNHPMTIKTDGTIWLWGDNTYGQLGDGTLENKNTPQKLGKDSDWKEIAAGGYHSLAIKTDGSLWAWGNKYYAQLGDGKSIFYSPSLAKPIVDIANSGRNAFCPGGSVVLTASSGGLTYTWSTGAKTQSITVNETGDYFATVTYPIGDVSTSDAFKITVNPLPDVKISTTGSYFVVNLTDTKTYTLKVPNEAGAKYQWSKDGANISGATTAEFVPQDNGSYGVKVTSPFGCIANSDSKVVKYELADTDGDGIKDNADKCNNTTAGAIIDANGCEIFNLPAKNYTIGMGSATCVGSNNGSINISFANKNYNYLVKAVGVTSGYSKQFIYNTGETAAFSISGLVKDTYSVCIQVLGKEGYEQCFDVIITEPAALKTTSTFDPKSNTLALNLAGSDTYSISINGVIEKVNTASYLKVLNTGVNKIIVSTDLGCQGKVEEEIFISEQAQAYPNPTSGLVSIYVPGIDTSVRVAIHTLDKILTDELRKLDNSRIIEYDLSKMEAGTYLIQVSGQHVNKTLKLIKQ